MPRYSVCPHKWEEYQAEYKSAINYLIILEETARLSLISSGAGSDISWRGGGHFIFMELFKSLRGGDDKARNSKKFCVCLLVCS